MSTSTRPWMGNRVQLQEIEGTGLTVVQWCRPWNGAWRGVRVLDRAQLARVEEAVERAVDGGREDLRLDHLAGRPLDLEAFLADVVD